MGKLFSLPVRWRWALLAATLGIFAAAGIAYPFAEMHRFGWIRADFRQALEADFAAPTCADYANRPLGQLPTPEYSRDGGNCWHLYTSRSNWPDYPPYTIATYDRHRRAELVEQLARGAFWGGAVAAVSGVLIYVFMLVGLSLARR